MDVFTPPRGWSGVNRPGGRHLAGGLRGVDGRSGLMTAVQMGDAVQMSAVRRRPRNHSVLRNPAHATLALPCDRSTRRDQIGYRAVQAALALAGLVTVSMTLVDLLG